MRSRWLSASMLMYISSLDEVVNNVKAGVHGVLCNSYYSWVAQCTLDGHCDHFFHSEWNFNQTFLGG